MLNNLRAFWDTALCSPVNNYHLWRNILPPSSHSIVMSLNYLPVRQSNRTVKPWRSLQALDVKLQNLLFKTPQIFWKLLLQDQLQNYPIHSKCVQLILKFSVHFQFVTANPECITQLMYFLCNSFNRPCFKHIKMLGQDFILEHAIQDGTVILQHAMQTCKTLVVENGWVVHAVLNTVHCKACQNIHNTFLVGRSIWLFPV